MIETRNCSMKNIDELTAEWDRIANARHDQISSGLDLSFTYVTAPSAIKLLDGADLNRVLDVGSGTGHFTRLLSTQSNQVIGIEPSHKSVQIAEAVCKGLNNVKFLNSDLEAISSAFARRRATAAVGLMVLSSVPRLFDFAAALHASLKKGAIFVAIIPHPCFWPKYWEYENREWFAYDKEIFIEAPFSISKSKTNIKTTHIHRPLHDYTNIFSNAGFRLDSFQEPMPDANTASKYPAAWVYPRFAAFRWAKE
jgi:SAM-dependent methyltransferase